MESGINRVSVAKTIRIPPKHNGAISVSIKGHDIKTPTACFVGSQYTDTDIKLVDGIHDISRNATLQFLVINNLNHHVNFPKRMKIGHLEPLIDDLAQILINSATTQKMLPETIKPDSFMPPKYQLEPTIQQQLDFLLRTFKNQFTKDETTIGTTPLTQMSIDMGRLRPHFPETLSGCNETLPMGKRGNRQTVRSRSNQKQPLQLVGTHHHSAERRWRQAPRNRLQSTQQSYKKICMANAESRRYFLTTKWCKVLLHSRLESRIPSHWTDHRLDTKNGIHITIWQIRVHQSTLWTGPSTNILPRIDDRSSEGPTICNGLLRRHHHI